tara:strand:+ start:1595 stop:2320 length:726 start_codon:yes stop_codon:yes gene_type:complete
MKLEEMTWYEVQTYLQESRGIILPTGSVEQHGPLGLIGTDSICAREIAWAAAERCNAIVAPEISYSPAPFNMSFPGTVSLTPAVFESVVRDVLTSLAHHGFERIYILNGHGANLSILRDLEESFQQMVRVKSWWDFKPVNILRDQFYGDWEGMHATPSEIAITQDTHRIVRIYDLAPPEKLSPDYIAAHAGDKHGPPDEHRKSFPDGRVGSHSGLAEAEHGEKLLKAAARAVAEDYLSFVK